MSIIDIVAAIFIIVGVFRGYRNGIIKELAGLLGLLIGIWAGLRLAFFFADWYKAETALPGPVIPFISFITAFALALAAVLLAGKIITFGAKTLSLGFLNRAAGAVFGILKMALVAGAIFFMIDSAGFVSDEGRQKSVTLKPLKMYVSVAYEYSIGLIPAAKNVFAEMDAYFTDIIPREDGETPLEEDPGH